MCVHVHVCVCVRAGIPGEGEHGGACTEGSVTRPPLSVYTSGADRSKCGGETGCGRGRGVAVAAPIEWQRQHLAPAVEAAATDSVSKEEAKGATG